MPALEALSGGAGTYGFPLEALDALDRPSSSETQSSST
jgi:hypothetical protein